MRRPFNDSTERATPEREFTQGDPQTAIKPTQVSADFLNILTGELGHVVEFTGQTLDDTGADKTQIRRAIQSITGEGYRVGSHLVPSFDLIPPSEGWPWFRLTQPDTVVYSAQWPEYVPYLRSIVRGSRGVTEFSGTISANGTEATLVFAPSVEATRVLQQLEFDLDRHGSFDEWFTLSLANGAGSIDAGEYSIAGLDAATLTVKFAIEKTVGGESIEGVSIYPYRIPGFTDRARHFQKSDDLFIAAGGAIDGGTRRGGLDLFSVNQGAGAVGVHWYSFGLYFNDVPLPPVAPTVSVQNGGFRRSRLTVEGAGDVDTITLSYRAGLPPSLTEFDGQQTFSGVGPHVWQHTGLTEGETYYYSATAANVTGESVPTVPVSWTETDEVLATYTVPGGYNWLVPEGITRVKSARISGGGQGGGGGRADADDGEISDGGAGGGGGSGVSETSEHDVVPGELVPLSVGAGGSALGSAGLYIERTIAQGGARGGDTTFAGAVTPGGAGGGGGGGAANSSGIYNGAPGEDSAPFSGGASGGWDNVRPSAPFDYFRGGGGGGGENPGQPGEDGELEPAEIRNTIRRIGGAGGVAPDGVYGAGGAGGDSGTVSPSGTNQILFGNGVNGLSGTGGKQEVIG